MILTCPHCRQKNRVPAQRLGAAPVCGQCKNALDRFGQPIDVRDDEFEDAIHNAPGRVFVDFWAPWCGPCRTVAPEVARMAEDHPDLLVLKLNTEDSPRAAQKYNVRSIPMFGLFEHGQLVQTEVGAMKAEQLVQKFRL